MADGYGREYTLSFGSAGNSRTIHKGSGTQYSHGSSRCMVDNWIAITPAVAIGEFLYVGGGKIPVESTIVKIKFWSADNMGATCTVQPQVLSDAVAGTWTGICAAFTANGVNAFVQHPSVTGALAASFPFECLRSTYPNWDGALRLAVAAANSPNNWDGAFQLNYQID